MDLFEEYVGLINPTTVVDGITLRLGSHTFQVKFDYRPFRHLGDEQAKRDIVRGISREEYLTEIGKMKADMRRFKEDPDIMKEFVMRAPKKKDGTFINGRVLFRTPYPKTTRGSSNWYRDYRYYTLKVKTTSDLELRVVIEEDVR